MLAAQEGFEEGVDLLLANGADANAAVILQGDKYTALSFAQIELNRRYLYGEYLSAAMRKRHIQICERIIQRLNAAGVKE